MFARSEEVYCEVKMVFLRYMNYWLTTTTTVTQYSYTVTSKIASLQCTPRLGWEIPIGNINPAQILEELYVGWKWCTIYADQARVGPAQFVDMEGLALFNPIRTE